MSLSENGTRILIKNSESRTAARPDTWLSRKTTGFVCAALVVPLCLSFFMLAGGASALEEESVTVECDHGYAKSLSKAFRSASEKVLPSVVMIQTSRGVSERKASPPGSRPREDCFRDFFRAPEFRRYFKPNAAAGIGSGVIIDGGGVILTNNHVVDGAEEVIVRLQDGREFVGKNIRRDPKTDLAVLTIEGVMDLTSVGLGDSDNLEIGDWVLALGQPFGLEGTVTAGIVSAKGRGIGLAQRESFIQTDAAINPGNSGGPLVNLDGQVVGINTAISSSSGGNQGVGFAIPVNLVRWVSDQLVAKGKVQRSYLGVSIQPVTRELANRFGVEIRRGVLISGVAAESPAANAGLKDGDVLLSFSGQEIDSPRELQVVVEQAVPGVEQPMEVVRDGKTLTLSAVCRQTPANFGLASFRGSSAPTHLLGLEVGELSDSVADRLGLKDVEGVVITHIERGSTAAESGLETGNVITQVNRQAVKSVADFKKAVADRDDKGALFLVRTARGSRYVVLD